ncbi:LTA synthase family protein [Azotobacter chroococcum]|jgi:phosphoglycerol transferase MdoB-like AlkP superfamily enzyme|uniref:Phosphoglycerol transferase MdoB-like AlkP superfamily enzyme n=1 Tax=Azotobacter chroococcum TaxID=353 RepID=A0A4R1PLS6_9GAMM|nr:LTA synthase family protein [Azotobacter chroococcum]TBV99324.1 LTA synthase family protein [Azotobacter chroococcum]TCL29705.1 phosphoglycerol transferase MdoB-like AlkP superfamily enzyme [Azotobacter chroococcum]
MPTSRPVGLDFLRKNHWLSARQLSPASFSVSLGQHLAFTLACAAVLMALYSLLRLALLLYNGEQIGTASATTLAEAFLNGLRFDLRLVVYVCAPLLLAMASRRAMRARALLRTWLTLLASLTLFLGVLELDFYREFHQRLNGLVFQYLKEDPQTVLSMLWHGFPVLRYLSAWLLATLLLGWLFGRLDRLTRSPAVAGREAGSRWPLRALAFSICLALALLAVRGTWRQGPPLRWGDAFTTDSMFANRLGLNGSLTLLDAVHSQLSDQREHLWKATLASGEARQTVRQMLLTNADRLVDEGSAAVRRDYSPPLGGTLPVRNVVVILMESFAGHYVGALGAPGGITPNFDRLAQEGLLFTRFFSNGTHTHQGMFATMACFPNLPGFEYLMQTPEGGQRFSGLPQLLGARGYDSLYVYNGDFAWDNQSGFFGSQGMKHFIGRHDFVDPVFSDPTWGVSDQDMFERAAEELERRSEAGQPFYALLQTLSNHTPYALPEHLPVAPVSGFGELDPRLTAMRYADWALGRFFERARHSPYFKDTLFVVVGDHGFGSREQLTEMDLLRFNVPLLLIGPGVQEKFGARRDIVGTQLDIVPTVMGRLGGAVRHQCWGRDLLDQPADSPGFGVIKPSGGDQTVALVSGDRVLVQPPGLAAKLYRYRLGSDPASQPLVAAPDEAALKRQLNAFLQTATASLLEDTAGVSDGKPAR